MINFKNKVLNNIGLKLLSVVCAIIMWIVVMNISDYSVTVNIDDIPVSQINGDVLEELDQIYDVESGDTVDIIVKGRRSVVSRLSKSDFNATADLSTMSITNTVQIMVEPKDTSIIDDISITYVNNIMSLTLEDKISVQFPVKVNVTGNPEDGYAVGETSVNPNIITVEGPRSTVERITEVTATVSANTRAESFEAESKISIKDAYGDEVNNDRMTVSHELVNVKVAMYLIKEVPVKVDIKGKPEDGFGVKEIQYQPQVMKIAGPDDVLDTIEEIKISDVSISGLKEDLQTSVDTNKYLPDGAFVAQPGEEVVINARIEKYEEINLHPTVNDIVLNNKNEDYAYEIILSEGFSITAYGLSEDVADIDVASLKLKLDCAPLSVGDNINVSLDMQKRDNVEYKVNGVATIVVKKE